uniref:Uncharacterized protein n=1 Tax=Glossina brevipalpis TaxID=37001 RepID=A0A1A9X241_9MUSC
MCYYGFPLFANFAAASVLRSRRGIVPSLTFAHVRFLCCQSAERPLRASFVLLNYGYAASTTTTTKTTSSPSSSAALTLTSRQTRKQKQKKRNRKVVVECINFSVLLLLQLSFLLLFLVVVIVVALAAVVVVVVDDDDDDNDDDLALQRIITSRECRECGKRTQEDKRMKEIVYFS